MESREVLHHFFDPQHGKGLTVHISSAMIDTHEATETTAMQIWLMPVFRSDLAVEVARFHMQSETVDAHHSFWRAAIQGSGDGGSPLPGQVRIETHGLEAFPPLTS